tara:strand:+ start:349 stop:858 length:510 start_codon:yes stop_codon:yes gene_type:complete
MKLLTTIAAVLISISAFSQNYVEYNEGAFSTNGEELSMEQINDLTVLHKAGRGNIRRANRFDRMHKNPNLRVTNNIVRFTGGAATGFFGGVGVLFSGILIGDLIWNGRFSDASLGGTAIVTGATTYFCVVSYKAFSRITVSPAGCLRKRDKEFKKVADKINEAIQSSNQ